MRKARLLVARPMERRPSVCVEMERLLVHRMKNWLKAGFAETFKKLQLTF
jgi:hypothetical protein